MSRRSSDPRASSATSVGDVTLTDAIMLASGTAGHGAELAAYGNLSALGAVVTKSLAAFPWEGNRAPRVAPAGVSMINAVGLAGPGVAQWLSHGYEDLRAVNATVVASIWGRTVEEFAAAAAALRGVPVAAVEINASCPNLEARNAIFANSPDATAEVVAATDVLTVPRWVKLTTTAPGLLEVVDAAVSAGASAVTLGNTLTGLVIDIDSRQPVLGNGGGGVSGEAARPVALRAVFDVRAHNPNLPIVGVGGVSTSGDALAMIMAGADAVQVGTVTFADPRAPWKISRGCREWMDRHGVVSLDAIKGAAHG